MKKFDSVIKEIERILPNSPIKSDSKHSKLTLKWLLKLKPDADEALKIAALSHDIDRAVTGITEKDLTESEHRKKYYSFKKKHALRSAKIIADIMRKRGYDRKIIEKVEHLVKKHEVGGDEETDALRDADSISYFDYNVYLYLKNMGKEKTKKKIEIMYNRMSVKAKKIVKHMKFRKKEIASLFNAVVRC